jgi:hypothetical protein
VIIIEEEEDPVEMVLEQEAHEELEIITPEEESKPLQPRVLIALMRDHQ